MEVTKQTILGLKVLSNDLNRSPLRFPSKFCLPESTSEFLVSQKKKALSLSDFLQQKDHENEVKKDFFFFFGHNHSLWKFLGQRQNQSSSHNLCHSCCNARSLTHCSTSELPIIFKTQASVKELLTSQSDEISNVDCVPVEKVTLISNF